MLDVVSLIASVMTIATVVIEGVKHARTFYHASEEFGTLQVSNTLGTLTAIYADILIISGTNWALYRLDEGDQ